MSYGVAAALQVAVYQSLTSDPALTALVGDDIYDAAPTGAVPSVYVSLGPETAIAAGDNSGEGARHRFIVSVVSENAGFQKAKSVAAAVSDVLHEAAPPLSRGRVVWMRFQKATAHRVGAGAGRQVDLRFEARVEDN